jgi:5'(3')-deoxyribonucleotidase
LQARSVHSVTIGGCSYRSGPMRLGIDLDGVVADFNAGWIRIHRAEFGSDLLPEMVTSWNAPASVGGFADMSAFWQWARGNDERPSIFRHLDPYDHAIQSLRSLVEAGHDIIVITSKPRWARSETYEWLAEYELPTTEVHITWKKYEIICDVYLDDSPSVLPELVSHHRDSLVCRFVRPWNQPVAGATDVDSWAEFESVVAQREASS